MKREERCHPEEPQATKDLCIRFTWKCWDPSSSLPFHGFITFPAGRLTGKLWRAADNCFRVADDPLGAEQAPADNPHAVCRRVAPRQQGRHHNDGLSEAPIKNCFEIRRQASTIASVSHHHHGRQPPPGATVPRIPDDLSEFIEAKPAEMDSAGKGAALREAYTRLYAQNHFLRESMFKVLSAALGIMGLADGWLFSKSPAVATTAKAAMTAGHGFVCLLGIYITRTTYHEFVSNAAMIVRVERALGFYNAGFYTPGLPLYEPHSSKWGTGVYSKHLIRAYVIALSSVAAFSIILTRLL